MHGKDGGTCHETRTLTAGEFIIGIQGRTGNYVDSLTVLLNTGRKFGPYGRQGGQQDFKYLLDPPGDHIIGFFGNCGEYIDSIGIYTRRIPL
jgi:hypothetical protein